ncbi:MAG: hypothetical protein BACD_03384 [Bacteroides rodentium]
MFQIQSLFFYTLGLYLKLYNIEILPFLCKYRHLFIITAILSFALRYISGSREFMPIFIISASGLIFYFSSLIQKLSISEQIKSAKKYSFFIYALHMLLIERLYGILHFSFIEKYQWTLCISYCINPIIIVSLCILCYNIITHVCPRFLSVITGNRT